jgi:hypothetical protein
MPHLPLESAQGIVFLGLSIMLYLFTQLVKSLQGYPPSENKRFLYPMQIHRNQFERAFKAKYSLAS